VIGSAMRGCYIVRLRLIAAGRICADVKEQSPRSQLCFDQRVQSSIRVVGPTPDRFGGKIGVFRISADAGFCRLVLLATI
jgi:hypothetical protein